MMDGVKWGDRSINIRSLVRFVLEIAICFRYPIGFVYGICSSLIFAGISTRERSVGD